MITSSLQKRKSSLCEVKAFTLYRQQMCFAVLQAFLDWFQPKASVQCSPSQNKMSREERREWHYRQSWRGLPASSPCTYFASVLGAAKATEMHFMGPLLQKSQCIHGTLTGITVIIWGYPLSSNQSIYGWCKCRMAQPLGKQWDTVFES